LAKGRRNILLLANGKIISGLSWFVDILPRPIYPWARQFPEEGIDYPSNISGNNGNPFFLSICGYSPSKSGMRKI
jgi:hypothetical protein